MLFFQNKIVKFDVNFYIFRRFVICRLSLAHVALVIFRQLGLNLTHVVFLRCLQG